MHGRLVGVWRVRWPQLNGRARSSGFLPLAVPSREGEPCTQHPASFGVPCTAAALSVDYDPTVDVFTNYTYLSIRIYPIYFALCPLEGTPCRLRVRSVSRYFLLPRGSDLFTLQKPFEPFELYLETRNGAKVSRPHPGQ